MTLYALTKLTVKGTASCLSSSDHSTIRVTPPARHGGCSRWPPRHRMLWDRCSAASPHLSQGRATTSSSEAPSRSKAQVTVYLVRLVCGWVKVTAASSGHGRQRAGRGVVAVFMWDAPKTSRRHSLPFAHTHSPQEPENQMTLCMI